LPDPVPTERACYLSAVDNSEIARALYDLADAMEMGNEPAFKIRAFRGAARSIEGLTEPAADLLTKGTLTDVRGIGAGVAKRVAELVETGDLTELVERKKKLPPGLVELVRVPGVGLKTAEIVWRELQVGTVDELEAAARRGAIRALPRFGAKKEEKLLEAIAAHRTRAAQPTRWTLGNALHQAAHLVERMRAAPGVLRAETAGSLRRRCETIGDIDILVAAPAAAAPSIMAYFAALPDVAQVLVKGDTKTSVMLREGLQADLRVILPETWGAALQYFTGSKEHNVAMRAIAVRQKLKVSEYGVFDESGARIAGAEEADVYAAIGLSWMPPELRENRGEIEASAKKTLPALVELADIRGDLHMHTIASDGKSTLAEMVLAAQAAGREYVAITDHSQSLTIANGMTPERLAEQGRLIRELDEQLGGAFRVLRGIETDILADGSVDLGPEVLRGLDWVVGSVHSHFGLTREEQTKRIVKALESGVIDVLGHPTGRMLTRRDGYTIDLEVVLAAAKRVGAAVELNASPHRLDLDEHGIRLAREMGVPVIVSSDAHNTRQLDHLVYGTGIARRAWLEPAHVANTLPVGDLLDRFAHHHARA
jgi:DNA polymerase (family X)